MSEMKKCKHCQTEIDKKAKVCPACRRKQGGKLKFVLIGLLVIAIIGALLPKDNDGSESNDNNSGTQNNSSDSTDKTKKADTSVALGSEGQSEDLILTVNEVGEKDEITEGSFISYKPDSGKYAVINITIKNNGKEAISLTNGYFKLVTEDEAEYRPTILIGLDNKYISFESINPGLDITGNLVFEVPTDLVVSDTTLRFSGTGLFSAATNFSLK